MINLLPNFMKIYPSPWLLSYIVHNQKIRQTGKQRSKQDLPRQWQNKGLGGPGQISKYSAP